jgi:tripartite-type tricarboxylate transporter receptor subunit TctC
MRFLVGAIAIAATLASIPTSSAQTYPSRPIAIVVPFAAGGPTDVIARTMARHMQASLG